MAQSAGSGGVSLRKTTGNRQPQTKYFYLAALFAVIAIAGLFYVKWNPYYQKALLAAAKHSIGSSIISGQMGTAPEPSWAAAWGYAAAYFKSVWKAVILGLLLGSLVQVLLPKDWIYRMFGKTSFAGTAMGGIAAIPSMMCTCCAAPVAVGLRKSSASPGASLSFWLANPLLNPATIIFMGFVLSWKFALLRIVAGAVLVLGLGYVANVVMKDTKEVERVLPENPNAALTGNLFVRWLKVLGPLVRDTIPAYLIMVFVLGALRAWLFPAVNPGWAGGILAIVGMAIVGTAFIIPTAAEIPIVQTLMSFGLGVGPGAALLVTLPAISIPSLIMVKRVFSLRLLLIVTGAVALAGGISGLVAMSLF